MCLQGERLVVGREDRVVDVAVGGMVAVVAVEVACMYELERMDLHMAVEVVGDTHCSGRIHLFDRSRRIHHIRSAARCTTAVGQVGRMQRGIEVLEKVGFDGYSKDQNRLHHMVDQSGRVVLFGGSRPIGMTFVDHHVLVLLRQRRRQRLGRDTAELTASVEETMTRHLDYSYSPSLYSVVGGVQELGYRTDLRYVFRVHLAYNRLGTVLG